MRLLIAWWHTLRSSQVNFTELAEVGLLLSHRQALIIHVSRSNSVSTVFTGSCPLVLLRLHEDVDAGSH